MRIIVFCHVEPGMVRDREIVFHPRYTEGITVALPRIVDFADEYGVPITFAMTPTALKENETNLSGNELGVHLHPQDAQLRKKLGRKLALSSDCLMRYSAEDQATLIDAARELFEQAEGYGPRTFVAGNWSENSTTLKLLVEAGFLFDGSPLPQHMSECADWTRIPRLAQPYTPSIRDYQSPGSVDFLYIPVFQGLWNNYLTPESLHLVGTSYFRAALKEALIGGAEVVHMFFHSPMAMDPFFLSEFGHVVERAQDELGVQFALASSLRPSAELSARPFPPAYLAYLNWRLIRGFVGSGELGRRLMDMGVSDGGPQTAAVGMDDEEDAE